MDIAYLQCDARFNQWLLEKIGDHYAIEYTIEKIKNLNCQKIIAGIYDCPENRKLIEIINNDSLGGVDVRKSSEKNVNLRFLNMIVEENAEYVVRVGGDQLLIDTDWENEIIEEMRRTGKQWFFDEFAKSILPDIVSIKCIKENWIKLVDENRYFDGLIKWNTMKRHELKYPFLLPFEFRINSNEGFRICKSILLKQGSIYEISKKMMTGLTSKNNYLIKSGIWGSWLLKDEDYFWDEEKNVNPWMAKSLTDLLKKRLNKNMVVFEWGTGNSTLFWGQYVNKVYSIEYDKNWYKKIIKMIPQNVNITYCVLDYNGDYCRTILKYKQEFDVIVIDGRDRVRCARNAVEKLKDDGVIIWDDTDVEQYKEGIGYLKDRGFKQLELSSLTYKLIGWKQFSSVFYRENNILGI